MILVDDSELDVNRKELPVMPWNASFREQNPTLVVPELQKKISEVRIDWKTILK